MNHSQTQLWSFPEVDKTADSHRLVNFLDNAFSLHEVKQIKRQSYELLDLREGEKILEVGCGTGEDVLALSEKTGVSGLVVGVDNSEIMIAAARQRAAGTASKAEFHLADAYDLKFSDNEFDACRAERLFVHLKEPAEALREMVRVIRPSGRVLALEGDFETLIINHPDRKLTRRIINYLCDQFANGWIGRELPSLFKAAGLTDIKVLPVNLSLLDFASVDTFWMLTETVSSAAVNNVISNSEANDWLNDLKRSDQSGAFFCNTTGFIVTGRKGDQTKI